MFRTAAHGHLAIVAALAIGIALPGSTVIAAPTADSTRQIVDISAITSDGDSIPVDPVVEEPIRPLFPEGQSLSPEAAARCGGVTPLAMSVIFLLGQAMRLQLLRPRD